MKAELIKKAYRKLELAEKIELMLSDMEENNAPVYIHIVGEPNIMHTDDTYQRIIEYFKLERDLLIREAEDMGESSRLSELRGDLARNETTEETNKGTKDYHV